MYPNKTEEIAKQHIDDLTDQLNKYLKQRVHFSYNGKIHPQAIKINEDMLNEILWRLRVVANWEPTRNPEAKS